MKKLSLGDTAKITKPGRFKGMVGKITSINYTIDFSAAGAWNFKDEDIEPIGSEKPTVDFNYSATYGKPQDESAYIEMPKKSKQRKEVKAKRQYNRKPKTA